uniref:ARAD1D13310p n=1 Tax=Blastobotrys adeninivorans TaxID=409370 RepID=A0A060TF62_BLAAD
MKHLVVFGGTGFLGRHIVNAALKAQWKVTSVSKSGAPVLNRDATYYSADVFEPPSYEAILSEADAVVHSMGTIFENTAYKKVLNGGLCSLPEAIPSLLSSFKGHNPMKNRDPSDADSGASDQSQSFERLNRDSAIILAKEFAKVAKKTSPFVYISAEDWNPLVDRRYILTKRQAEMELASQPSLRPVFVRPGFMYDSSGTSALRNHVGCAANAVGHLGSLGASLFGSSVNFNPAIPVQVVANAVVESLSDDSIDGVVSLEALQKYATMTT